MKGYLSFCFIFWVFVSRGLCQETALITLENVSSAKRIVADEPLRKKFSAEQAARYLDNTSLAWQKRRNCVTCHTNMAYLMARPALSEVLKDSGEVRGFFESYYLERWGKGNTPPKHAYNPVVVGSALAFNDAQTSGELSAVTRQTLDMMWKTQRSDGGWNWAKCGWAPMEIDDHFGVTLAALAVGIAPGNYRESEAAKKGMEKIRQFLEKNRAHSLHHRIMLAWASLRIDGLIEDSKRKEILKEMLSKQLSGGGWATPAFLVDWEDYERLDKKPHDPSTPDAYGTGLAIIVAREMGIPAKDQRIQKGIEWLKNNQRQSGSWITRSPAEDSKHYITNTSTAFAVLALQSCGEFGGWPFGE